MDERRNLILIKGENKTWQIDRCHYDPKDQRYHVTFDNEKFFSVQFIDAYCSVFYLISYCFVNFFVLLYAPFYPLSLPSKGKYKGKLFSKNHRIAGTTSP